MARKKKKKQAAAARKRHRGGAPGLRKREPQLLYAEHTVRFTTDNPVAVQDVILSLEGMDTLVRQFLPKAIYELTGARVLEAGLLVQGIEQGSLVEKTIVTLLFKDEKSYQRFLLKVREAGIDWFATGTPVMKGLAIGIVLSALALAGLAFLSKDEPQSGALANIQGDSNVVLIVGAEAYQSNPEAFAKAIEKAVPKNQQKALATASAELIAPSKAEPGAGIELQAGNRTLTAVSPATISAVPATLSDIDSTFDQQMQDALVEVRATDIDSTKRGWAATIDRLVEKRTRVVFAHDADMLKVAYTPRFRANVTITYAPGMKPILITIDQVL